MIPVFHTPMDSAARAFGRPGFGNRPIARQGFSGGSRSLVANRPAALGQTWDQMMGLPGWCGDCVRFLVHGSTGVLGIYVGTLDRGFMSVLGWIVGLMSGFAAVLDLASIIARIFGKE